MYVCVKKNQSCYLYGDILCKFADKLVYIYINYIVHMYKLSGLLASRFNSKIFPPSSLWNRTPNHSFEVVVPFHPRNFEQDLLNGPRSSRKFNLGCARAPNTINLRPLLARARAARGSRGVCSKGPVENFLDSSIRRIYIYVKGTRKRDNDSQANRSVINGGQQQNPSFFCCRPLHQLFPQSVGIQDRPPQVAILGPGTGRVETKLDCTHPGAHPHGHGSTV